jgi:uncharacterized membrane protein
MADNTTQTKAENNEKLNKLKTITGVVYLCQVLAFALAGLPLLIGVVINLVKRKEVMGTWLESHFDWQIKTVWVALALFAVSGLTLSIGIGAYLLLLAVLWLVYRIAFGWYALHANKPIGESQL